jgi:hypothetical protein
MSLHALANHLQDAGRGEDKVLVHMTPGEVKGLQSLAMSQGGSLSINPETGLPEAGILSSLLPMVAGFFLGPAGVGLTAMQSAVAVGALGTAATGSLGKGFMMGLGAYGGAGLGAGLTAAGAPASVTPSVANPTLGGFTQNTALANAGTGSATTLGTDTFANVAKEAGVPTITKAGGFSGMPAYNNQSIMFQNVPSSFTPTPVSVTPTVQTPVFDISKYASPSNSGFTNLGEVSRLTTGPTVNVGDVGLLTKPSNVVDLSSKGISDLASTTKSSLLPEARMSLPGARGDLPVVEMSVPKSPFVEPKAYVPSNLEKAGEGFKRATGSWEGAKEVWNATPKGTGYGLAATGMSVLQAQQEEEAEDARRAAEAAAYERRGHYRPYDYSVKQNESAYAPSASTAENVYFDEPRFTARPIQKVAKEGGLMSLATGGPVEQMAAENAIGSNAMYPQSQLQTPMYSNPMMQRPMPNDVISAGIDAPTDRYTGEQRFALGGSATASAKAKEPTKETKYSYNPETMQYTQTTTAAPAANNRLTGNPMIDGMVGLFGNVGPYGIAPNMQRAGPGGGNFTGFSKGFGGLGGATINPAFAALYGNQQSAPQPTVSTEISGGTTAPYVPQGIESAASNMPMVPNMQLQPQQDVDRQLGLEAFYPMMEQQLAMRGAKMKEQGYATGGMASGGYNLGGYSDGGRLLKGPGDGVSDSIPAVIGNRQPARLADGEFVIPARIVSELGNGSTEAGARKLYAMMDRVQKARRKTVGKNQIAKNTKVEKLLPA